MPFAIITRDKPGHAHVREAHQTAHKAYLDRHRDSLLAAGAMLEDDGLSAHGGVLLLDLESREAAENFVRNDPFSKAGLFSVSPHHALAEGLLRSRTTGGALKAVFQAVDATCERTWTVPPTSLKSRPCEPSS